MADVYLHVGLPKTGTTSIQLALTGHATELASAGVLFPGGRHIDQRRAVHDLLGQRIPGEVAPVAGAFDRVFTEMRDYRGDTILYSEEALARARPRHVRRVAAALEGHRLFVVVTLRDLGRLLTSAWQQAVVMGGEVTLPDFLASVRDPEHGTPSVSTSFWLKHDVLRTLDVWGTVVPPDRVLLVTVPPAGSPASVLFQRFGEAVGVPSAIWASGARPGNVGLGTVETEVIRRLNGALRGSLAIGPYRRTVEDGIRSRWHRPPSRPPRLTADDLAWARMRARQLVTDLEARGHPVVGDLADLVPRFDRADEPPEPVTEAELLAGTESALAALAVSYGTLSRRHLRLTTPAPDQAPSASAVRSALRAAIFRAERAALRWSDHVPPLGWLARRYVRRR